MAQVYNPTFDADKTGKVNDLFVLKSHRNQLVVTQNTTEDMSQTPQSDFDKERVRIAGRMAKATNANYKRVFPLLESETTITAFGRQRNSFDYIPALLDYQRQKEADFQNTISSSIHNRLVALNTFLGSYYLSLDLLFEVSWYLRIQNKSQQGLWFHLWASDGVSNYTSFYLEPGFVSEIINPSLEVVIASTVQFLPLADSANGGPFLLEEFPTNRTLPMSLGIMAEPPPDDFTPIVTPELSVKRLGNMTIGSRTETVIIRGLAHSLATLRDAWFRFQVQQGDQIKQADLDTMVFVTETLPVFYILLSGRIPHNALVAPGELHSAVTVHGNVDLSVNTQNQLLPATRPRSSNPAGYTEVDRTLIAKRMLSTGYLDYEKLFVLARNTYMAYYGGKWRNINSYNKELIRNTINKSATIRKKSKTRSSTRYITQKQFLLSHLLENDLLFSISYDLKLTNHSRQPRDFILCDYAGVPDSVIANVQSGEETQIPIDIQYVWGIICCKDADTYNNRLNESYLQPTVISPDASPILSTGLVAEDAPSDTNISDTPVFGSAGTLAGFAGEKIDDFFVLLFSLKEILEVDVDFSFQYKSTPGDYTDVPLKWEFNNYGAPFYYFKLSGTVDEFVSPGLWSITLRVRYSESDWVTKTVQWHVFPSEKFTFVIGSTTVHNITTVYGYGGGTLGWNPNLQVNALGNIQDGDHNMVFTLLPGIISEIFTLRYGADQGNVVTGPEASGLFELKYLNVNGKWVTQYFFVEVVSP